MAHESQGDNLHAKQQPAGGNEAVWAQRQQGSAAGCGPEARMDAQIASLAVGISALISAWHWPHVRLYRPAVPFVELSAVLFRPPTPKSSNNESVASCSSDAFSPHGMTASHDNAAPPRRRLLPPAASALDESTSGLYRSGTSGSHSIVVSCSSFSRATPANTSFAAYLRTRLTKHTNSQW